MLLTIVSFLFVFTIITIVHEFGHLYFSKKAGIRVHEFGLGFGPTLFSMKRNNTTYKINALPILGYVKIAGIDTEDPEEKDTPENEKYYNKSTGAKFRSIVAGPMMNLILGFLVYTMIFTFIGVPSGISNEISAVSPGSEAAKVGLKPGDKLISIDGKTYNNPEEAIKTIHQNPDKTLTLGIERNNKLTNIKATPKLHKRAKIGLIGFSLKAIYTRVNPLYAIYYGFKETVGLILLIFVLLGKLFVGQLAVTDLAGPVGIAQITGQYASRGAFALMNFIAFFSINVAVINLLPLPALDGGRLFFLLIEFIRRKPINIETENKIHSIGLILFLILFALLTVNDVLRIFRS